MKKNYSNSLRMTLTSIFLSGSLLSFATDFTVTNTNNSGAGSLAQAITDANANPGADNILFDLPEGGSMTISLTSALPNIIEAVFINGYSQSGSAQGTIAGRTIRINIDGTALPAATNIFNVLSTNVTIAGLAIYKSTNYGIYIGQGATAKIWGNYIGTDSTGLSTTLGNTLSGIQSNAFSGLGNSGISIGVDGDGVNDANEGNLISCNGEDGVFFWRTSSSTIAGNIIGLNKNGLGAGFGNVRNGILLTVNANSNVVGTDGDGVADGNEGNYISNNGGRAIFIASVSNSNIIAGNIIGLNSSNAAAGNGSVGNVASIEIFPGSGNRIGTDGDGNSDALERNTICSGAGDGISIQGGDFFGSSSNSDGNIIASNAIGTNSAGSLVRGNAGNGITILTSSNFNASDNIIGSNEDGQGDTYEGNIIANNAKGIVLATPGGTSVITGNRFSRNSIYDNTGLGIDLANDGITGNDNGDGDAGANNLMNFPFITKSNVQGGNLVITGIAPADAVIDFYIADASGLEGKTYLFSGQEGTTLGAVTDDSTGTDSYSDVTYGSGTDQRFGFTIAAASLPATVTTGTIIVAVATGSSSSINSSSEFGPAFVSTLPVRLGQFNGRLNAGVVTLEWNTLEESGNSYFEVERSANGSQFSKIGTVLARSGTSNTYSFVDGQAQAVNFYRLKQVDKNGKATYSKVVLVRADLGKGAARISPNPFVGSINVAFELSKDENITLRLYNQNGQLVKQQTSAARAGINTLSMSDLSPLPAGNYTLELKGTTLSYRQLISKQ